MSPGRAQRTTPRHEVTVQVTFESKRTFHAGVSRDFGPGGAFIATSDLLPVGDCARVRFTLPDIPEPFDAIAEVRWVREQDTPKGPGGMGLQFIQMSPKAKVAVRAFCAQRDAASAQIDKAQ